MDAIPSNAPESTQARILGDQLVAEYKRLAQRWAQEEIADFLEQHLKEHYLVTVTEDNNQLTVTALL